MSDPSEATEPPAADTEESKPPADPPATAEPDAQPKAAETGASNASKGNKNGKRSGKGKTGQGRGNKSPQRSPLGTDPAQRKAEKQEHLQASVIKNGDRLSELLVEMDADKDGKVCEKGCLCSRCSVDPPAQTWRGCQISATYPCRRQCAHPVCLKRVCLLLRLPPSRWRNVSGGVALPRVILTPRSRRWMPSSMRSTLRALA